MNIKLLFVFLFFASISFAGNFNAEVLSSQSSLTVKNKTLYESYFIAIRINNSKGDDYAKIKISYSEDSPLYDLEAWIEDTSGNKIRVIKGREVTDASNIQSTNLFDDNCLKSFELKYNVYPYVIKYQYCRKKKEFFTLCDWSPIYNYKIPTLNASLTVNIPNDYKIAYYQHKTNAPVKDSSKKGLRLFWETKYESTAQSEVYSPPINECIPRVFVVPIEFDYGVHGTQNDWQSFGNWVYNLNTGLDELPGNEIEKVQELTKGITDKKLIVESLYHYLQDNTRYVSIQVGIGKFKSCAASEVATNKYGDCKGLCNYMKALLKTKGIQSYLALVYADPRQNASEILDKFVASQFNHALLLVPLGLDSIWLDCTSSTNPCGYLGVFTQNRYALVIDEKKSQLVKTPALNPSTCFVSSKSESKIDTVTGDVLLSGSTICKGEAYEKYRQLTFMDNKNGRTEYLREVLSYKDFNIKKFSQENYNRDSGSIGLNYQIILDDYIIRSGHSILFSFKGPGIPSFEVPGKRTFPVRLSYPINYIDTLVLSIPQNFKVSFPNNKVIKSKYGAIQVVCIPGDSVITLYRTVLINSGEYSLTEYPDFYSFISKLNELINVNVGLTKNE
jgi:transglutaminase-like putative cysteine protease